MADLILASSSPRRKDFVSKLGLSFDIVVPDIDESVAQGESARNYVKRMAYQKASLVAHSYHQKIVLAADTIVVCDDVIVGKPVNREDAKRILRMLSGRTHEVMTAVCIKHADKCCQFLEVAEVTFAPLSEELIDTYVASGECDDKSGAYAVQGIGAMLIERVCGSVSTVVGLPICQVRCALEDFGLKVRTVSV